MGWTARYGRARDGKSNWAAHVHHILYCTRRYLKDNGISFCFWSANAEMKRQEEEKARLALLGPQGEETSEGKDEDEAESDDEEEEEEEEEEIEEEGSDDDSGVYVVQLYVCQHVLYISATRQLRLTQRCAH